MRRIAVSIALALTIASGIAHAGTATIKVDGTSPGTKINPRMYGIFLEEINFGVDGGLYAEMIRNRGFEDAKPPEGCILINGQYGDGRGWFSGYQMPHDPLAYWQLVRTDGAKAEMFLDTENPLNTINERSLRLEIGAVPEGGRVAIVNEGFWGINCVRGEKYNLKLHARCAEGFAGLLTITLEDASGSPCTEPVKVTDIKATWKEYNLVLTATRTNHTARFAVSASSPGKVWFDSFSLMPTKTFNNRRNGSRADIAQMLADLKPGFMRFPGGCVVEGGTIETAYNWKKTIGEPEKREEIWNDWGYRRTHGMGFFEYLQFAEDIGAEPLFVGFAGQTCAYREWEHVPMEQMGWVVDGFLDAIEYANGSPTSKWGAMRVKTGHTKPFGLKMVEIGNENMGDGYIERYPLIYKAIKDKYPDMNTIACFEQKAGTDMVDHHYYNNPYWFLSNNNLYDRYDRKAPKVYVGEAAVNSEESGENGNLFGALAEAAFSLGMERNGDVVRMASYAPLLCNLNAKNWKTNLINFDSYRVFGSPSYYAQKMLSRNCSSTVLPTDLSYKIDAPDAIKAQLRLTGYGTDLEVKDLKIKQKDSDIYASDFATREGEWTKQGNWSVKDGVMTCKGGGDLILKDQPASVTDYTVSCKIRKTGGNDFEGFILVFGKYAGDGPVQWNVGGWSNKRAAIQGGGIDSGIDFSLTKDQWYDVKIEVSGAHIKASIDGKLLQEVTAPQVSSVYALAGRDEKTGEMIVKVVNTAGEPVKASLELSGFNSVAGDGKVTVLTGDRLRADNTLSEPTRVCSQDSTVSGISRSFTYEFAPYSFTVIRFKAN